jgi:LysM repeat protein
VLVTRLALCLLPWVAAGILAAAPATHTVQRGDTLSSIARQYNIPVQELRQANPSVNPDRLLVGQTLKLPARVETSPPSPPIQPPPAPPTAQFHTVQRGDTLTRIAAQYKISVAQLKEWNELDSDAIMSGRRLRVSPPASVASAPPAPTDSQKTPTPPSPPKKTPTPTPSTPTPPEYLFVSRVKNQIDAPRRLRNWKYVVIHHSGTRSGNARIFHHYHLRSRGMENGLAYHFVIGNGTDSGDGEIEVGPRWTRQLQGGHLASEALNEISIGICFVGDFNRTRPTRRQIAALVELMNYLQIRMPDSRPKFRLHREINTRPTDCPGRLFPAAAMHRLFG